MTVIANFYRSTIGKKVVMALTGLVLVGFVIGHMAGNLKLFAGIDPASGVYKLDHYGQLLRSMGEDFLGHATALWLVRIILLGSLVLHVISALQLASINKSAKGIGYQNPHYGSSNPASRTMVYGGLFLLCFIIYHILHFTTGQAHLRGFEEGLVYQNVYNAFQSIPIVVFYILSMLFLCLHLFHGTWSIFQTLGVDAPLWNKGFRMGARVVAIVLFIGFCSVPIAVSLKLVAAPPHVYSAH